MSAVGTGAPSSSAAVAGFPPVDAGDALDAASILLVLLDIFSLRAGSMYSRPHSLSSDVATTTAAADDSPAASVTAAASLPAVASSPSTSVAAAAATIAAAAGTGAGVTPAAAAPTAASPVARGGRLAAGSLRRSTQRRSENIVPFECKCSYRHAQEEEKIQRRLSACSQ